MIFDRTYLECELPASRLRVPYTQEAVPPLIIAPAPCTGPKQRSQENAVYIYSVL